MPDLKRGGGFPSEGHLAEEVARRARGGSMNHKPESCSEGSATEKRKSLQNELYTHRACFPGSPSPMGSGVED